MATLEPYGVPVSATNERRKLAKALAKKHRRRIPLARTKPEALEVARHVVAEMSDADVAFLLRRYSTPKE